MANKSDIRKKVVIALPVMDDIRSKTAFSLMHTINNKNDFDIDIRMRIGCDIIGSRTGLVREALNTKGATHMLFVDHDMYFPPTALASLVASNKDIIGASYNFRREPPEPVELPLEKEHGELFQCHVVGTGFMLVKLSVFEKIPEPWFQFGRDDQGELKYGEDSWFCRMAREHGFEVWADSTLGVRHLGEKAF